MEDSFFVNTVIFIAPPFLSVGLFFFCEVLMKNKSLTKRISVSAMFAALAFAVAALSNLVPLPLIPSVPFLQYDPKDAIIALSGFILGPVYALGISLAAALLELSVSGTGAIGALMNFLSSAVFSVTAALIYKKKKDILGALIGLAAASAVTTVFMLGWNYLITPLYMGIARYVVASMLLPAFLPFNAVKYLISSGITLLIYKPVVNALRKARLVEGRAEWSAKTLAVSVSIGLALIALSIIGLLIYRLC